MSNSNEKVSFLLSRLLWPSSMVRERACNGLANLMINPEWEDMVKDSVLNWISAQKLESTLINGLLVFLRANQFEKILIEKKTLLNAINKPSILSWILLNELGCNDQFPGCKNLNSGLPPDDFEINNFFKKYLNNFLTPAYFEYGKTIEELGYFPFMEQWAFEWSNILKEIGKNTSNYSDNINRFARYTRRYRFCSYELSEIYKSSFLRAIAFGTRIGALSEEEAKIFSIKTCPIDLEVWKLEAQEKPTFWPKITDKNGIINIKNQIRILIDKIKENDKWMILEAGGRLCGNETIYDLELFGSFQNSKEDSDIDIEYTFKKYNNSPMDYIHDDPLTPRLLGYVESFPIQKFENDIIPASGFIFPHSVSMWQYWRMYRNIWLPMPFIIDLNEDDYDTDLISYRFEFSKNALNIFNEKEIIAKWMDWKDSLIENSEHASLSPSMGQYLMIKKEILDKFTEKTNSKYSWLCSLTKYERKYSSDLYNKSCEYYKLDF